MRHLKLIGMRCNLDQPEIPAALQFGGHYQIGAIAHLVQWLSCDHIYKMEGVM